MTLVIYVVYDIVIILLVLTSICFSPVPCLNLTKHLAHAFLMLIGFGWLGRRGIIIHVRFIYTLHRIADIIIHVHSRWMNVGLLLLSLLISENYASWILIIDYSYIFIIN